MDKRLLMVNAIICLMRKVVENFLSQSCTISSMQPIGIGPPEYPLQLVLLTFRLPSFMFVDMK